MFEMERRFYQVGMVLSRDSRFCYPFERQFGRRPEVLNSSAILVEGTNSEKTCSFAVYENFSMF